VKSEKKRGVSPKDNYLKGAKWFQGGDREPKNSNIDEQPFYVNILLVSIYASDFYSFGLPASAIKYLFIHLHIPVTRVVIIPSVIC
jgi:hypothetical protein